MTVRLQSMIAVMLVGGGIAACSDATSPNRGAARGAAAFSGVSSGGVNAGTGADTGVVASGGGGGGGGSTSTATGGGGGGGGGSTSKASTACGTFGPVTWHYIGVYTTRTGIGFTGSVTNCGSSSASFEVDVQDTNPDPACVVQVPHFIGAHNTGAGAVLDFTANSTLVPCTGVTHDFVLTLIDDKTGTAVATTTASAFY
jgi:hypothetical protein